MVITYFSINELFTARNNLETASPQRLSAKKTAYPEFLDHQDKKFQGGKFCNDRHI